MRNLFALIGFAVVAFAVVGWYCGWYRLSVQKGEGGKAEIQTVVDTKKVTEDSTAFFHKLGQLLSQKTQATGAGTNPAGEKTGNASGSNKAGTTSSSSGLKPGNTPPGGTPPPGGAPPFSAPPVSIPPFSGKTP